MTDETEVARKVLTQIINNEPPTREELEKEYGVGNVWTTNELQEKFKVIGFMAPMCVVQDKVTGKKGTVYFAHMPRFYFDFQEDN